MRGTLQVVTVEDAGPLLGILGPQLIKNTSRRYAELGLTPDLRAASVDLLEDHLLAHGPCGRKELADVLVRAGLIAEPKGQQVYALIRHAGLLGRLCYGPGHDRSETWVAVRDWLGKPLAMEGDLESLAHRYLSAYGPATARDFATWSGLPVPAVRRALEALVTTTFELDDDELLAVEDLAGCDDVRMLGEFDPYLLGYQNRRQDLRREIFPGGGMLRPAVVRSGRAIGTWTHTTREVQLFDGRPDLTDELRDLSRFAGRQ
jgi:hypothetical protein